MTESLSVASADFSLPPPKLRDDLNPFDSPQKIVEIDRKADRKSAISKAAVTKEETPKTKSKTCVLI